MFHFVGFFTLANKEKMYNPMDVKPHLCVKHQKLISSHQPPSSTIDDPFFPSPLLTPPPHPPQKVYLDCQARKVTKDALGAQSQLPVSPNRKS
jgi:hypothetical protein